MAIKISNIQVIGQDAPIEVKCPRCEHLNHYVIHTGMKFQVIRPCYDCGARLSFDVEEVNDE